MPGYSIYISHKKRGDEIATPLFKYIIGMHQNDSRAMERFCKNMRTESANKIIPKRQFCVVRNTKMPMAPAAEKLLEIMELDRQEEAKI